jgi:hypothetical protein
MFGFLNSTVLLAAAAALIPLLIHLFSRRRVKVVEFSSLRHLKEMQKRQLRRLRIRQWLLLILRMLIILAAVLAFARPTARQGDIGSHAAVSAVVLFDNSPSMDRSVTDGNLLDIARQRTRQLLETLAPADRVALLELDRSTVTGPREFVSSAVALEQLSRIERGATTADLTAGLTDAAGLLQSIHDFNREIYYVGDRQRISLPSDSTPDLQSLPVYALDLPVQDGDNIGLVSVDFGGQLIHPGHDFNLVATIRNYGLRDSGERIASLFIDGKRIAQTDLTVPGGGETTVRFARSVSTTGFHAGYVELTEDRLAADNKYFFSFRIPEQFNLLIIDGDPVAGYASLALTPPGGGSQYWSTKTALPNDLSGVNFDDYQVVMLAGVPRLPEAQHRRLESYLRRGGALMVFYGAGTEIAYFNEAWTPLTGVTFVQPIRRDFTRAGYYTFDHFDLDHPIFQPFGFERDHPPDVKFYTIPRLQTTPESRTLLTFTGGQPALVENRFGRGRVLTFCGPTSPEHSDLTSHGFFVPFVSRAMEYLAADLTGLDTRLFAGESLTRSLPEQDVALYAVELIGPDGSISGLAPEDDGGALVLRTGILKREGIYSVQHRGWEIDRFAVNLNPEEGDLSPVDPDQLAAAFGADRIRRLGFDQPLAETIADFRVGKELWQIFLWAAAVLLAVEMLLGRKSSEE